jgi:hypothetical protein
MKTGLWHYSIFYVILAFFKDGGGLLLVVLYTYNISFRNWVPQQQHPHHLGGSKRTKKVTCKQLLWPLHKWIRAIKACDNACTVTPLYILAEYAKKTQ